ncbi:A/G-specific adenine glycosylase [Mucilaginibacter sp. AW1-3]
MNFTQSLAQWYRQNKRDLPWRNTTDPYVIWLSEIILQQTRVEQGKPYFYRFAETYPTVSDFASASEDEILKLWQGLGYYSRGRNMLTTARLVKQQFNGVFPGKYEDLIGLKGIGEYTAAAISSFSTNQARAVVDGNVSRVMARYFGIAEPINSTKGKKLFQQMANELLDQNEPGLHNQAMMEFGAMLCKPRNPLCEVCPVKTGCYALQHNQVNKLPVKLKTVKIKQRYFNYWLITDADKVLLNKRDESDIWANMYDVPLTETAGDKTIEELLASPETAKTLGFNPQVITVYPTQKHILTHQHIYYRFIRIENNLKIKLKPSWFFSKVENLNNLALPKIIFLFLTKFFEL